MNTLGLLAAHLFGQTCYIVLVAYITRQDMNAARTGTVQLLYFLQSLLTATGYVDLGTIRLQRLGDHQADASSATSHNGCDVGHIKEGTGLEVLVLCFCRSKQCENRDTFMGVIFNLPPDDMIAFIMQCCLDERPVLFF